MSDLFLEYKKRPGRAVLAQLLERNQDAVYSLCYRVLRHPQDAEDACQEVLLEVSRQVDAIEQPAGFAGWLYRTTLHTALDAKRRRGRRKVREAAAGRAARPDPGADHEALYCGLDRLDESTRMLVVEHYLAQRPLRELADERGCSEVAVWKRIRSAREELRRTIGSAGMSALDGAANGGLAMAVKGGMKIAVAAPLLLLAAAGLIAVFRQQPEAPVVRPAPSKHSAIRPSDAAPAPAPAPSTAPAPVIPKPTVRKPYPLALPSDGGSEAARETWRRMAEARLEIDCQDQPIDSILRSVAGKLGMTLMLQLPTEYLGNVTFKVLELNGDSCLRLLLGPRQLGYEIRPDGAVFVGPADQITGGYEKAGQATQQLQWEVKQVRLDLEHGWDGIGDASERRDSTDRALRSKPVLLPQGTTTWMKVIERLNFEYQQTVLIDAAAGTTVEDAVNRPFVSSVEEPKMGTLIERIARN